MKLLQVITTMAIAAASGSEMTVSEAESFSHDAHDHYHEHASTLTSQLQGVAPDIDPATLQAMFDEYELADITALATQYFDLEALERGQFTLFLPTDTAFAEFFAAAGEVDIIDVAKVLAYHASASYVDPTGLEGQALIVETLLKSEGLEGPYVSKVSVAEDSSVTVSYGLGEANVISTFVLVEGSIIIHVIDTVLLIPVSPSESAVAAGLSSLVDALVAADLVEAVDTTPQLTIFAPTNDAFAEVGEVDAEALPDILTYHVVPGVVGYSVGLESTTLTTLLGLTLEVEVTEAGIFINGNEVVIADVLTDNGVVHVISGVLLPSDGGEPDDVTTLEATDGAGKMMVAGASLVAMLGMALL